MPVSSLNSVKIRSCEPETVIAALKKWTQKICSLKPEIEALGYFGSYATNRYGPGSDLDVLIILRESPHQRFFDRIPELYPASFPIGVDIFAYTRTEVERMESDASPWLRHIMHEIIWVFESRARQSGND